MSIHHVKEALKAKIPKAEDLVIKKLHATGKHLEVMYFKTISDEAQLQTYLIKPFYEISAPDQFLAYLQSHPKVKSLESEEKVQEELIRGISILFWTWINMKKRQRVMLVNR
ncbi:hypothetical protein ABLO26_10490 [Neobacillus sp. 179-J 1A1 HS]|uniref:hypothetical protein n=1 Tax=Neobacillus driksii TaxID=3035913 RepID=UPI0035BC147A